MDLELEGSVALVAVSSRGLGKATARALAREGAGVVVNGRTEATIDETVAELADVGPGRVVGVPADLTVAEDVDRLVDETVEAFGRLDHLITNAGGPASAPVRRTTEADWIGAYELLVLSAVRLVWAAAEHLERDGGTITMIASRAVEEAVPNNPLSNSVRMGVVGLGKTLSMELAPAVRTNAVLPGAHATDRIRELAEQKIERGEIDTVQDDIDERTEAIPLDRLGDPIELGNAIAFLCSPRAGFVNGETITVDGGRTRATL
ncbi:SDR family oxidoreductase [Halovivax limisalsi]|uniref:SDR family oxidoreductase n=1 Tax=Halovivax limisalsi TaxID=1453760 RepID=UPI001FFD11F3|nr:SDR family oxidoreductase [Halovivax limisalsi]